MITQAQHRTRFRYFELIVLMGVLQAFAPLSIDMYLPSMPLLEKVFSATTAQVQITLVTFLLGYALGQSLYGPLTDRFGRVPVHHVHPRAVCVSVSSGGRRLRWRGGIAGDGARSLPASRHAPHFFH